MPRRINSKPRKLQARKRTAKHEQLSKLFPCRSDRAFREYLESGLPLLEVDLGTGSPIRLIENDEDNEE
jgi:hypothetical protein